MTPSDQNQVPLRVLMGTMILPIHPLTAERFAPFGQVLEARGAPDRIANEGTADVYQDRVVVDVGAEGGRVGVSLAHVRPRPIPMKVEYLERHPLGSQAIAPLGGVSMLVIVAPPGPLDPSAIVAFLNSGQTVNYNRDVWHAPLILLGREADVLFIDRMGPGCNLVIERLPEALVIENEDQTR